MHFLKHTNCSQMYYYFVSFALNYKLHVKVKFVRCYPLYRTTTLFQFSENCHFIAFIVKSRNIGN